jgi:Na+:H+ antiporter, NhaA family
VPLAAGAPGASIAMISRTIREFIKMEAAAGILLMLATLLALVAANSPLRASYQAFLDLPVAVQVGEIVVAKPLLLWINDGLMAVFFFLIGLEVKREILEGELADPATVLFPAAAALGGMLVPAAVFTGFNHADAAAMAGWAIPLATDIAFALGLLALLGSRVPTSLKLFLLTLAIFDDLGAIVIIAVFYTTNLSISALVVASSALAVAVWLNRRGVIGIAPYILLGVVMWVSVLKSGVHATLAGVALAFTIPLRTAARPSPLRQLEQDLHAPVAYVILPLFAFANAGLNLAGIRVGDLWHPITLGVAVGLVVGKLIGVLGFAWLSSVFGFARKPDDATWTQLAGIAALCGVGFTMSLFIAGLAFEGDGFQSFGRDRLGILLGSAIAAIIGVTVLAFAPRAQARDD